MGSNLHPLARASSEVRPQSGYPQGVSVGAGGGIADGARKASWNLLYSRERTAMVAMVITTVTATILIVPLLARSWAIEAGFSPSNKASSSSVSPMPSLSREFVIYAR